MPITGHNSGPELWNDLASQKMFEYRMSDDAPAVARIYTVLNVAYHDAAIAIFDAKYAYWGIRPNQYDTTYKPLISTPPFPGYPSGMPQVLQLQAPYWNIFFLPMQNSFNNWHRIVQIHGSMQAFIFVQIMKQRLRMGEELGKYVVETWMKK